MEALSRDLAGLASHYMRRPGAWLIGGLVWWFVNLVALLLCGINPGKSLNTLLEITFAISAPPDAVAKAYHATYGNVPVPDAVRLVGSLGWTVIVAFTLLIPALVALILERLPNIVATLWPLASTEVWSFFRRYTGLMTTYHQIIVRERYASADDTTSALSKIPELRVAALRATASIVQFWYRGEIAFNVNASYMRLVSSGEMAENGLLLYASGEPADQILELDGWAHQLADLPSRLMLNVDRTRPRPGAPFAVVNQRPDVVANTLDPAEWRQRGLLLHEVEETLDYFRSVPFRSFVSIPVWDIFGNDVIGVVSVQVDKPAIFVAGNPETDDLVELVGRFCYFLSWLEARRKDGESDKHEQPAR